MEGFRATARRNDRSISGQSRTQAAIVPDVTSAVSLNGFTRRASASRSKALAWLPRHEDSAESTRASAHQGRSRLRAARAAATETNAVSPRLTRRSRGCRSDRGVVLRPTARPSAAIPAPPRLGNSQSQSPDPCSNQYAVAPRAPAETPRTSGSARRSAAIPATTRNEAKSNAPTRPVPVRQPHLDAVRIARLLVAAAELQVVHCKVVHADALDRDDRERSASRPSRSRNGCCRAP